MVTRAQRPVSDHGVTTATTRVDVDETHVWTGQTAGLCQETTQIRTYDSILRRSNLFILLDVVNDDQDIRFAHAASLRRCCPRSRASKSFRSGHPFRHGWPPGHSLRQW